MTKEEYERLLQSDYWKGYSYSLIKERNFTCEDCGRSFPNERNMLQVHHLVYRDVNPWSYRPEEVIVLCKECHQRRHGILPEPESEPVEEKTAHNDNYTQSYSSSYNTSERNIGPESRRFEYPVYPEENKNWTKYTIIACLLALLLYFGFRHKDSPTPDSNKLEVSSTEQVVVPEEAQPVSPSVSKPIKTDSKRERPSQADAIKADQTDEETVLTQEQEVSMPSPETTTKKEETREKTTLEILEERNHASVVEQAKRAGVSTEGTTIEILERINHASVVKQAQRAGVSTEGSTTEILERINHASVVEQAKRAGVSTEGTTIEILERINRKNLEKYNH